MAAALQPRVAAPPLPDPFAAAFVPAPRGVRLNARQFQNSTAAKTVTSVAQTTLGQQTTPGQQTTSVTPAQFAPPAPNCAAFNGFQTCSSAGEYGACLAKSPASVCNCANGVTYLDCVSAAIAASNCWKAAGIPTDWDAYERNWIETGCPTTPASTVMAQLPQPSTVQVELSSVNIVTPPATASLTTSNHVAQPTSTFNGAGQLLAEPDCKSTSYTLVSAEDVVYYAAFVGCAANRPQCCPWSVSVEGGSSTTAADEGNRVAGGPGQFPIPANNVKALLERCPDDYYSVSGQCCPNGYYKFTRRIAYQTPCFSSFKSKITPPVLTAGLAGNPTDTSLPTSAVINVAWAMGYNVTSPPSDPPLSRAAAIGIGVGAGVFALLLIALTVYVFMRVRKNKKQAALKGTPQSQAAAPVEPRYRDHPGVAPVGGEGVAYQQGYHPPAPGSPPLPSPPLSDAGGYQGRGHYPPVEGHARGYSDASDGGWSQRRDDYQPPQGYQHEGYPGGYAQPYQEQQQPRYQQGGGHDGYFRN